MSARILAVFNEKGGVGKTTTAVNLSSCLAQRRRRTLLVDLDPQHHATLSFGCNPARFRQSLHNLLAQGNGRLEGICQGPAGSDMLLLAAMDLEEAVGAGPQLLCEKLQPYLAEFDFVVIDCPPALGATTVKAIAAATEIVIPVQTHYFAVAGLERLLGRMNYLFAELENYPLCRGLATMVDHRAKFSRLILEEIRERLSDRFYRTSISLDGRIPESAACGRPMITYAPDSRACHEYQQLSLEVLAGKTEPTQEVRSHG